MYGLAKTLGKSFLIAGMLPALFFVGLNLLFFGGDWFPRVPIELSENGAEGPIMAAVGVAVFVLLLNTPIIKLFEGSIGGAGFVFGLLQKRNLKVHDRLFSKLKVYQNELAGTSDEIRKNSLAHAIEQEWLRILPECERWHLPIERRRVLPTRLGNLFASIEEYPSIRYGMDGMLFWPRLVPLIPEECADMISNEKLSLDLLLNLSLLAAVLSVELAVKCFLGIGAFEYQYLAGAVGCALVFYIFYRLALVPARAMGDLIMSCFDLFRHEILDRMKLGLPGGLQEEKLLWYRLANYIASGEEFYYPEIEKKEQPSRAALFR